MKSISNSLEIPSDIKYINWVASMLFSFFIFLIISSAFQYIIKSKINNFNVVKIKGDLVRNDNASIRNIFTKNNVSENLYDMSLMKTKNIFEALPWISHAVVKRVYPNQIEVSLSEYKPQAIWGAREDMKLVDEVGTIFEASADEEDYESLPQLIGPEGQGRLMLNMYKNVSNALSPLKSGLKNLELNARGSWIAILDSGAHLELGRGNTIEVINRVTKFSMGAEKMLTALNKKLIDIQYVDLRHSDGYAMRMHGVSTTDLTTTSSSLKK